MEDNRLPFENKTELKLTEGSNDKVKIIRVDHSIGRGGSSLVYMVEMDEHIGILKEYYPFGMDIIRSNNELLVKEEDNEVFLERKNVFENILNKRKLLCDISNDIANTLPEYNLLLKGNNTSYIFQSFKSGQCYEDMEDQSIESTIQVTLGLVNALKAYHDVRYLHLDIKPSNMLVVKQNTNIEVRLFDYETATSIDEIHNRGVDKLPFTKEYAAPELVNQNMDEIGFCTDLYSVGVILFNRIMGRMPSANEKALNANYQYNNVNLLADAAPIIRAELSELFEHTIKISHKSRYESILDLVKKLEKVLNCTKKNSGIIQNKNYLSDLGDDNFIGRHEELNLLQESLEDYRFVLLYGIGGIGKSELVRQYLQANETLYGKIVYIEETGSSIRNAINDDNNVKIDGLKKNEGITEDEYFDNKIAQIRKEYEEQKKKRKDIILVFDNAETFEDTKYIKAVKSIGCQCLIISRDKDFIGSGFDKKIEVEPINSIDELVTLFEMNYDGELDEDDRTVICDIIKKYEGHTLLIEMMAKEMSSSWISPAEIQERISIRSSGDEDIEYIAHEGKREYKKLEDIIFELFKFDERSKDEIEILQIVSMASVEGIPKKLFRDKLNPASSLSVVKKLIKEGMIKENQSMLKVHPILKEMVGDRFEVSDKFCGKYIEIIKFAFRHELKTMSVTWTTVLVSIAKSLISCREINDSVFYDCLANACQRIGLLDDAIKYCKINIELIKKTKGEESEDLPVAYMRIGRVLGKNGLYEESLKNLDESAKRYNSILCASGPAVAGALVGGSIGGAVASSLFALRGLKKDLCDTEKTHMKVDHNIDIKEYDKLLDLSKTYNQLARWYCEQGEYKEALKYCDVAYDIAKVKSDVYDRAKHKLYYIGDTKASVLYECEKYDKALELYFVSKKMKEELGLENTVYMCPSYFGIAKCLYALGRYQEAADFLDRARKLSEELKGIDNIETAKIYNLIGNILKRMGRGYDSIPFFEQANEVLIKQLGFANAFSIRAKADLLLLKVENKGALKDDFQDEYNEISKRIDEKQRSKTHTMKEVYLVMRSIAEVLGVEKGNWIEKIREIEEYISDFDVFLD